MNRSLIPAGLRAARAADIAQVPDRALKAMQSTDVAPRLNAAAVFRRRAAVPHLDADLYRSRLGQRSTDHDEPGARRRADQGRRGRQAQRDGGHKHAHASVKSAASGRLAKAAAAQSVTVPTPALDDVGRSASLQAGLTRLMNSGRLGEAQRELGQLAKAAETLAGHVKGSPLRAEGQPRGQPG